MIKPINNKDLMNYELLRSVINRNTDYRLYTNDVHNRCYLVQCDKILGLRIQSENIKNLDRYNLMSSSDIEYINLHSKLFISLDKQ